MQSAKREPERQDREYKTTSRSSGRRLFSSVETINVQRPPRYEELPLTAAGVDGTAIRGKRSWTNRD